MGENRGLYIVMIRGARYFILASLNEAGIMGLKEYCDSLSQTTYAYSRQEELEMVMKYIHDFLDCDAVELAVSKLFNID